LAQLLDLPKNVVRVVWVEASGCYGHNGADDVAADAALLSRAVGRPVRVQWMRHDEHGWEPKGPAMIMDVRGGLVINPDGVKNQIEGNVLQTISRALKEEVAFTRAGVTSLDWNAYPILTFPEVPDEVEVALIDRPNEPAVGAGEPTACTIPAAIANAIFDATGARVRTMPFTPERVRAALG
jgi:CO/xanthine dehydrogenase Mo-binding subunit